MAYTGVRLTWLVGGFTARICGKLRAQERSKEGPLPHVCRLERLVQRAALSAASNLVTDEDYRADRGAFFTSVHGTLNHLLVGDRIWMRRFTGVGEMPPSLDAILYDDFEALRAARRSEDVLIGRYIDGLQRGRSTRLSCYRTVVNPQTIEQALAPALDHFFNHQTHHRGQAHALLSSIIGNDATPSFDLIIYQRETGVGMHKPG